MNNISLKAWLYTPVWITPRFWMPPRKKPTSFYGMAAITTGLSSGLIWRSCSLILTGRAMSCSTIRGNQPAARAGAGHKQKPTQRRSPACSK